MNRVTRATVLLLTCLTAALAAGPGRAFEDSKVARIVYPAWFKQSFCDLRDDLAEARAAGKRGIVLFFSTEGCAYCHQMLETSLADPQFVDRLRARFDVVGLDMFDSSEITDWAGETVRLKHFAVREGAEFSPTLIFYGGDGRCWLSSARRAARPARIFAARCSAIRGYATSCEASAWSTSTPRTPPRRW